MRRAIGAATLMRLDALEAPRARGPGQGAIAVPVMLTIDDWEAQAAPYQAALIASMSEDADDPQFDERKKP